MLGAVCAWLIRAIPGDTSELEELPGVITTLVEEARNERGWWAAWRLGLFEVGALLLISFRGVAARVYAGPAHLLDFMRSTVRPDLRVILLLSRRDVGRTVTVVTLLGLAVVASGLVSAVSKGMTPSSVSGPHAERLSWVWGSRPWEGSASPLTSDLHLTHLRGEAESFDQVAAMWMVSGRVTTPVAPVHADVARVSANFFDLLGVEPALGRAFLEGEDSIGAPWVAVLSHTFWVEHFGADPTVLGTRIVVGVPAMTIVGVLPEGFHFDVPDALGPYGEPSVWLPARHRVAGPGLPQDVQGILARSAPDVSRARASAELAQLSGFIDGQVYSGRGFQYVVEAAERRIDPELLKTIDALSVSTYGLLGVVAGLIALLGHSTARRRRLALHLLGVIGGARLRYLSVHSIEGAVIALVGGTIGLAVSGVAWRGLEAAELLSAPKMGVGPWGISISVVLLGSALYSGVAAITNAASSRQRVETGGRAVRWFPVLPVACSVVVLLGALILDGRLRALESSGGGLEPGGRVAFTLYPMPDDYPDRHTRDHFFDRVETGLLADPRIRAVTAVSALPLSGGSSQVPVSRARPRSDVDPDAFHVAEWTGFDGALTASTAAETRWIDLNVARPGFFGGDGVEISRGRGFLPTDSTATGRVVILSSELERAMWGGADAVGDSVWLVGAWRRVIGISDPIALHGLTRKGAQAWVPHAQVVAGRMSVLVTGDIDPASVGVLASRVVQAIDPAVPVGEVAAVGEVVAGRVADGWSVARIGGLLSLISALLAGLALYTFVAEIVASRSRELAVRIVLGISRLRLGAWIVGEAVAFAAVGAALGVVLYAASDRLFDPMSIVGGGLPGPMTFVALAAGVGIVGSIAALLPAARAARTDVASVLEVR